MKPRYVKLISALICLAVVFTVIGLTRIGLHGASSDTVLFYNDRSWSLSNRLPAEQVHSVYYVPITFIVQLPTVDVRMNEALGTFVITHGDLFLSFDTTTDFAMNQDKERTYIKTAEYHSERYIPIRTVCAYLELGYEEITNPVTGVVAIRVTDGNERNTLESLVKLKYPSLFPETSATDSSSIDTSVHDTTLPPDTSQKPILSERTIYITIDSTSGAYTDSILTVLKRYGYSATFFITANTMKSSAALLSRISASDNEIALYLTNNVSDEASALADIKAQNELLSRLIKKKAHIWRAPDEAEISAEITKALSNQGYIEWGYNVDVPSSVRSSTAATTAINSIWANKSVTLRFKESKNTAEALRLVLDFIKTNSSACEVRTASVAFHENGAK